MSVSLIICVITVLVSVRAFKDRNLMNKLILHPYTVYNERQYWRLFSHGLIHADWMHLGFNMIALWSFGKAVEYGFDTYFKSKGTLLFVGLYVSALAVASIYSTEKNKHNPGYASLGASGAVSAIIYAAILLNPRGEVRIFFFPMSSWVFGIVYLVYSSYMAKKQVDNVGHDAHFYGAVYGAVFLLVLKPELGMNFLKVVKDSLL